LARLLESRVQLSAAFCDSELCVSLMITGSDVIPLLLEASPSFAEPWAAYRDEPSFDDDLLYVHLGEVARHLIHLFRIAEHAELRAALDVVERLHLEGDAYVREAATIGLLESLQNNAGHDGLDPDVFLPWLKPESLRWWKGLDAFWAGRIPAVLPIDS
jgi:hypothetical protein